MQESMILQKEQTKTTQAQTPEQQAKHFKSIDQVLALQKQINGFLQQQGLPSSL